MDSLSQTELINTFTFTIPFIDYSDGGKRTAKQCLI